MRVSCCLSMSMWLCVYVLLCLCAYVSMCLCVYVQSIGQDRVRPGKNRAKDTCVDSVLVVLYLHVQLHRRPARIVGVGANSPCQPPLDQVVARTVSGVDGEFYVDPAPAAHQALFCVWLLTSYAMTEGTRTRARDEDAC